MKLLLINILLALSWAAVSGSFTFLSLLFGFLLGAIALSFIRAEIGSLNYFVRIRRIASLTILFLYELVLSSVKVAMTVLSPRLDVKPGIVAYPLKVDRDFEITLLANLVTLTPGTMSVDISEDRRLLYIHALDASDPDQLRRDIASGFERKILEAFR
jgi:multicomponent Na+:H+ antiporter subunit E